MTVDPATLSRLLSLSVMDGVSNSSSQSDPFSTQESGGGFSDLLNILLLMMQNQQTQTGGLSDDAASTAGSGADSSLWQQMSASVPPLTLTSGESRAAEQNTGASASQSAVADYRDIVNRIGKKYAVDPRLIASVISAESGGNASAISPAGAEGLMQLMPGTAQSLGVTNALDPEQNIEGGTKYLRRLLDRYNGNISLALAAYNAGSGNVEKYGGIPPFAETQAYVRRVMGKLTNTTV